MRKLLFLFLFLPFLGWGQDWPTNTAYWNDWFEINCNSGSDFHCQVIKQNGDTTIDQKTYNKLFDTLGFTGNSPWYIGAIREDSLSKVWFYHRDDTTERLLYDFNANPGDTVMVLHGYSVPILFVDTVNIGGVNRRRLFINGQQSVYSDSRYDNDIAWIQGIGCTEGLFYHTHDIIGNYFQKAQTCVSFKYLAKVYLGDSLSYAQEGKTRVFDVPFDSALCEFHTLSVENEKTLDKISISPNPTTTNLNIQFANPNQKPFELSIFDNLGKLIYRREDIADSQLSLDVSAYPSGIYHYQLLNPQSREKSFGKFVKQ